MIGSNIVFIINPQAGSGLAGRRWPKISKLAKKHLGAFKIRFTSKSDDAVAFARESAESGAEKIVTVGGDGTLNEVVNGIMHLPAGVRKKIFLGFIPCGTGCDLTRTLPIPRSAEPAVEVISKGKTVAIDIGKIWYRNKKGVGRERYFHNVVSFGLGGEVDRRINRTRKFFGPAAFFRVAIKSILKFDKKKVTLEIDDQIKKKFIVWNVAVANGCCHGAGMKVAPGARMDDGLFEITVIGDMNIIEIFLNLPRLYLGNLKHRKLHLMSGKKLQAESNAQVLIDVDGEYLGSLPLKVEIIPGALNLLVKK